MNPGRLNRKIQLQRQAAGLFMVTATGVYMTTTDGTRMTTGNRVDDLGQPRDAWGLWKTRRARRIESKGGEKEANARIAGVDAVTFRIRYTEGLKVSDRLVDVTDGQAYDIQSYAGERRQGWMDVYCLRRHVPETANQIYA